MDYQELDAAGLVKFLKTDKEKEETKTVTSYDDHGQPTTVTTTKEGAPDSVEQTTCQDTVQGTTRTTTTTQGEEKRDICDKKQMPWGVKQKIPVRTGKEIS